MKEKIYKILKSRGITNHIDTCGLVNSDGEKGYWFKFVNGDRGKILLGDGEGTRVIIFG